MAEDGASEGAQGGEGPRALSRRLGVIAVTSAIRSHPSTEMMEKVIASFQRVCGLEDCRIVIICDGARKGAKYEPKRGRVAEDTLHNYEVYKRRLRRLAGEDVPEHPPVGEYAEAHSQQDSGVGSAADAGAPEPTKRARRDKDCTEVMPADREGVEEEEEEEEEGSHTRPLPRPAKVLPTTGHWRNVEVVELPMRAGFGHAVRRGVLMLDTEYVLVVQHDHSFDQRCE